MTAQANASQNWTAAEMSHVMGFAVFATGTVVGMASAAGEEVTVDRVQARAGTFVCEMAEKAGMECGREFTVAMARAAVGCAFQTRTEEVTAVARATRRAVDEERRTR